MLERRLLAAQSIDLPTSKQLFEPVPGQPQRINSLPMSMAVSPDAHYVVTMNAGYGTYESKYDAVSGGTGYADGRSVGFSRRPYAGAREADVVLGAGIQSATEAISTRASGQRRIRWARCARNGRQRPEAACWSIGFHDGKIEPERVIHLPLQQLAAGRKTKLIGDAEGDKGVPFPAAIAVVGAASAEKLLVAGNLSDDVLLIDAETGDD